MKKALLLFSLIGIAVSSSAKDVAEPAKASLNPEALGKITTAMQEQVDDGKVSGVIALISQNGEIGYHKTFGQRVVRPASPMTEDTLFRIYSMTKPIVAVTAMSLWEEGKFQLDDPISNHLPEWKNATVQVKGGEPVAAESPVTARQLMTHSSGLSYDRRGLKLGDGVSLEEFSKSIAARPLEFQPGTNYRYGYSIDVLGRYIEAIAGKPLDQVMRERVFDKLGMDDTEFWVPDADDRKRVAMVYTRSRKGELKPAMPIAAVMKKPSAMMGGQGLMSTSVDYAKFCQMLLSKGDAPSEGERVLKTETVELMFQNHLKDIGKVYGLGGIVDGKGSYSWGGAAGTRFWVDHRTDSYVVFMVQTWGYKAPTFDVFKKLAKTAIE